MAERTFTDRTGTRWRVWDVRPESPVLRLRARRAIGDRRLAAAPAPVIERRVEDRRRAGGVAGRPGRDVSPVQPGFERGWLVFEAVGTPTPARRLAPIPPDWLHCDDDDMAAYCRAASPARTAPLALTGRSSP